MKILGIDIGTVNLGFAILETESREVIFSTTIKLDNKLSLGERLNRLDLMYSSYVEEYKVEGVIIEKPNIKKADLYYPCGLFCYLAAKSKLEFQEVSPTEVKKYVAGSGKADKKELEKFVKEKISNSTIKFKSDHESDSVAVALCWDKNKYYG